MKLGGQTLIDDTKKQAEERALQRVQTQTKDELRELIAKTTAGAPVRRVEPAAADGLLSWGPTQKWTG